VKIRLELALILSFALVGCAPSSRDAPVRSPSNDYRPPAPVTSDGRTVGADGVDPRDRLEEGAKAGGEPGLAPGWKVDKNGLEHDPKDRAGGEIDTKHEGGHAH
jgi:hypothetical protein